MNSISKTCYFNQNVFPKAKVYAIPLQTTIHHPCRLQATKVIQHVYPKGGYYNHYNQGRRRRIFITSRQSALSTGKLVKKISTDIVIDGCCIAGNSVLNCVSMTSCISVFVTCILNNIFLNLSVNGSRKFWQRSLHLFKLGLITNTIGSMIYVQPFNVHLYTKYVVFLSLGMSILSNLRYSTLSNIERKIRLSLIQCVFLRVLNNIIGTIQQMTIIQYLVV